MKYTKDTRDACILILLASILIVIPIVLYYDYILNHKPLHIIEVPVETVSVKPNKHLFGLFIEVFKVNNSSYTYYPSHFSPINIKSVPNSEDMAMLDYIRKEQYLMLEDIIKNVFDSLASSTKLSSL
jgi:hypothetical protein